MDGDVRAHSEPPRSDEPRAEMLAAIPAWYWPWGHLAGTTGVGVAGVVLAVTHLEAPRVADFSVIPATFVFANLVEWFVHRYFMHERRRPLAVLYDRHTPEHHRVYRYESMAIRSVREFRLVLIPAAGVLGIVLLAAPVARVTALAWGANAGWLFLLSSAVYVVGYELSHLAYHLPETFPAYRLPVLRTLREHHARHHLPSLMRRANFNVTIPLADLLFGTLASSAEVQAARARHAARDHGASAAAPRVARSARPERLLRRP